MNLRYFVSTGGKAVDSPRSILRFSLASVPERERDVTLREIFGRALINMDFVPLTARPVLEVAARILPGVTVGTGRHSPHLVSGHDLSRENDDLMLAWPSRPSKGRMTQLGREIEAREGAAVLTSCADPCRSETHSEIRPVNVRVSRRMLLPLVPDAESKLMRPIPRENRALRLLTGYVQTLVGEAVPADPELDHAIALHVADLVALAVGTTRDATELAKSRGVRAARLAAVKRWILAHVQEPGLSVSHAAAAQGISPRYLQMLFADAETSFSAFVLSARLALVRRQLIDPSLANRPISTIVYDAGFSDLSYFNRAFRNAFGQTPSDARFGRVAAQ